MDRASPDRKKTSPRSDLSDLLDCAEETLSLLQALLDTVRTLDESVSLEEADEVLRLTELQQNYFDNLAIQDERFRSLLSALPPWKQEIISAIFAPDAPAGSARSDEYRELANLARSRRELIAQISVLHGEALRKTEAAAEDIRNRIRDIRQKKGVIAKYRVFDPHSTGVFLDKKDSEDR